MEQQTSPQRTIERQTAKILSLKEITTGKYVKQEGWEPNYVHTIKDDKVSRVNIIGVIVTIPDSQQSVFVDDGSAKIEIRSFENKPFFENLTIGDIVLVIGRPREYNNEMYINAEVVKKITNKGWLEYRKKEIALREEKLPDVTIASPSNDNSVQEEVIDENGDEIDTILQTIKELDSGNGCDVNELIEKYSDFSDIGGSKQFLESVLNRIEQIENIQMDKSVLDK